MVACTAMSKISKDDAKDEQALGAFLNRKQKKQ